VPKLIFLFTKDDLPASSKGVRGTIKSAINKVFTPKTEKPASKKSFNVINPNTGETVMEGVDEETAKKAAAKGYKYQ